MTTNSDLSAASPLPASCPRVSSGSARAVSTHIHLPATLPRRCNRFDGTHTPEILDVECGGGVRHCVGGAKYGGHALRTPAGLTPAGTGAHVHAYYMPSATVCHWGEGELRRSPFLPKNESTRAFCASRREQAASCLRQNWPPAATQICTRTPLAARRLVVLVVCSSGPHKRYFATVCSGVLRAGVRRAGTPVSRARQQAALA